MRVRGIIRSSGSSWAAPVVLIKINGTPRFYVDYSELNKVTATDGSPLHRIDDALDMVRRWMIFSSLDVRAGYWEFTMAESVKRKTAFRTPTGLNEFRQMPFDLTPANSKF